MVAKNTQKKIALDTQKKTALDEYYLMKADTVADRSTCFRRQSGAIIVNGKRALMAGVNGAPTGLMPCFARGCMRDELHIPPGQQLEKCRGIHSPQDAIAKAASHGINIEGTTIYCTHQPCVLCAKVIAAAKIKKVVYDKAGDPAALAILEEAGVQVSNVLYFLPTHFTR